MNMTHLNLVPRANADTSCPCCGGSNFEDNRLSEALLALAAQEAPYLRFVGRIDEARQVLNALWELRTENFLRNHWICLDCGSSFDSSVTFDA